MLRLSALAALTLLSVLSVSHAQDNTQSSATRTVTTTKRVVDTSPTSVEITHQYVLTAYTDQWNNYFLSELSLVRTHVETACRGKGYHGAERLTSRYVDGSCTLTEGPRPTEHSPPTGRLRDCRFVGSGYCYRFETKVEKVDDNTALIELPKNVETSTDPSTDNSNDELNSGQVDSDTLAKAAEIAAGLADEKTEEMEEEQKKAKAEAERRLEQELKASRNPTEEQMQFLLERRRWRLKTLEPVYVRRRAWNNNTSFYVEFDITLSFEKLGDRSGQCTAIGSAKINRSNADVGTSRCTWKLEDAYFSLDIDQFGRNSGSRLYLSMSISEKGLDSYKSVSVNDHKGGSSDAVSFSPIF